MFSRILVAGLLCAVCLPAYCQSPPATQTVTVPDWILYDHFFFRVTWLEKQANTLKAQGKNDSFLRFWMKTHGGLTVQEESELKAIAASCQAKIAAFLGAAKAVGAAGVSPTNAQQIQSLQNQRQQAVLDSIAQLKTAVGNTRFGKVDAFARRIIQFNAPAAVPAAFAQHPPLSPSAVPGK